MQRLCGMVQGNGATMRFMVHTICSVRFSLQVRQVSAQVHNIRGRVGQMAELLSSRGFDVTVHQEPRFADCNLHMVYGCRRKQ
jgi:hypothetical protein